MCATVKLITESLPRIHVMSVMSLINPPRIQIQYAHSSYVVRVDFALYAIHASVHTYKLDGPFGYAQPCIAVMCGVCRSPEGDGELHAARTGAQADTDARPRCEAPTRKRPNVPLLSKFDQRTFLAACRSRFTAPVPHG